MQKSMLNAVLDNRTKRRSVTEFGHRMNVLSMIDLLRISRKLHPPSI